MKTTMTAGRSSENSGRFAGGHFAGGHDGMANLCKPITACDFHVRYNKMEWIPPGFALGENDPPRGSVPSHYKIRGMSPLIK